MEKIMKKALEGLEKEIGQDKIMVLATRNNEGVSARTVNVFTYEGCFYFVTEADSNKYEQISKNSSVALSIDAIQIRGNGTLLSHPCSNSAKQITGYIEYGLPHHFDRYKNDPAMRLIKITPDHASFLSMETGNGYVINYKEQTAMPIEHQM
ncbi:pyridoxamine 5'-phosphate oxidase family protein [Lacrimispora sp. 38-1]|uniref:pyridoxamine 5'-phosphate oxidase family protein n=1 Tax=Lacrimispora sp. 38-1 TaxID=3125778 RepID=UPI003CF9CC7E